MTPKARCQLVPLEDAEREITPTPTSQPKSCTLLSADEIENSVATGAQSAPSPAPFRKIAAGKKKLQALQEGVDRAEEANKISLGPEQRESGGQHGWAAPTGPHPLAWARMVPQVTWQSAIATTLAPTVPRT